MLQENTVLSLMSLAAGRLLIRQIVGLLPVIAFTSAMAVPTAVWPVNRDALDPFAYEPGVATPLGPYLMRDGLKGPVQVLALNAKGEIIQTSRLTYDERGRLLTEAFFDPQNAAGGEIRYVFKNGLPVREDSYNQKGELLSSKVRTYQQGQLIQVVVEEKKLIKFQRSYAYARDRISIRESADKNTDVFQVTLDAGQRPVSMALLDQDKKPVQTIEYRYDARGRLQERLRTMTDSVSRCQYEYDEQGRLSQYIYADRGPSDWKVSRTIRLIYADRI